MGVKATRIRLRGSFPVNDVYKLYKGKGGIWALASRASERVCDS